MKNLRHLLAAALLLAGPATLPPTLHAAPPAKAAAPKPDKNAKHRKDAADFFAGMIPRLKIELSAEQRDKLHGHYLVEQLHLNGISVKSAQLTLLQHLKLLAHTEL